jgi:type IV pilus assembly protein PilE
MELMVVVAIIAILSAIAISAYGSYITRSRIQAAKGDLSALALNLENELQRNLGYAVRNTTNTDATVASVSSWKPAESGDFTFTANSSASEYTLVATGSSGKLVGCVLTLKSAPVPSSSSSTGSNAASSQLGSVSGCGVVTTW